MPELKEKADIEDNFELQQNVYTKWGYVNTLIPAENLHAYGGKDSYFTLTCPNSVSSSLLSSSPALLNFDLRKGDCPKVEDLVFRFTITCATAAVTVLSGLNLVSQLRMIANI